MTKEKKIFIADCTLWVIASITFGLKADEAMNFGISPDTSDSFILEILLVTTLLATGGFRVARYFMNNSKDFE